MFDLSFAVWVGFVDCVYALCWCNCVVVTCRVLMLLFYGVWFICVLLMFCLVFVLGLFCLLGLLVLTFCLAVCGFDWFWVFVLMLFSWGLSCFVFIIFMYCC